MNTYIVTRFAIVRKTYRVDAASEADARLCFDAGELLEEADIGTEARVTVCLESEREEPQKGEREDAD